MTGLDGLIPGAGSMATPGPGPAPGPGPLPNPIGNGAAGAPVSPMPVVPGAPGGAAGAMGIAGMGPAVAGAGVVPMAGGGAVAGMDAVAGAPAPMGAGACCAGGDCLCHGPDPSALTSAMGPFKTATLSLSLGDVYYPTDAEPPFASVAVCGGFLNTGIEMTGWGSFYASHGIVTVITWTTGADLPDLRGAKLLASLEELQGENTKSGSPLMGKLTDRMGTSGYSMGGGGTTIASGTNPMLRTSVGLAAWAPIGDGVSVPTLLLCGDADTVAPCSMSQGAYGSIPESTPKMMTVISGVTHFNWFGPGDAGSGTSGAAALAFQKVYLEGDERWKPLLSQVGGRVTTNIQ